MVHPTVARVYRLHARRDTKAHENLRGPLSYTPKRASFQEGG